MFKLNRSAIAIDTGIYTCKRVFSILVDRVVYTNINVRYVPL